MSAGDNRELHNRIFTLDAHADVEFDDKPSPYVGPDGRSRVCVDKLISGGMDAVVMSLAVAPGAPTQAATDAAYRFALKKREAIDKMIEHSLGAAKVAVTSEDCRTNKRNGCVSLLVGFQNAYCLGRDPDKLRDFYQLGARIFGLCHIGHNEFADSSRPSYLSKRKQHEPTSRHGGLSDIGKAAVRLIGELGAVVDVSQLSKDATLQTIDLATTPVIASHSNASALCKLGRNLSNEEIDAIADCGGVVHVAPFRGYLYDTTDAQVESAIIQAREDAGLPQTYQYPFELYWELPHEEEQTAFRNRMRDILGPSSLRSMIDHLDYIVDRVGVEHVGIGSDFNHGGGIRDYDEASDAPNVTKELIARGYSESQIAQIWGQNTLRVLDAAERS